MLQIITVVFTYSSLLGEYSGYNTGLLENAPYEGEIIFQKKEGQQQTIFVWKQLI